MLEWHNRIITRKVSTVLWQNFHSILGHIQHTVSFVGILIIVIGVIVAIGQYIFYFFTEKPTSDNAYLNKIRLSLGRVLILGLEFIVAGDLIATTATPDYYTVGILAIIVLIRTFLSFTISREISAISKESNAAQSSS